MTLPLMQQMRPDNTGDEKQETRRQEPTATRDIETEGKQRETRD